MLGEAQCKCWTFRAQETYLGQLRTMGSWRVYIFWTLLCATRLFYSYAHIQTEEYKAKHLPFFTMTEDNNEKQLVSYTWRTPKISSRAFREFLGLMIFLWMLTVMSVWFVIEYYSGILRRNTYQFCIFQINDLHEVLERLQNNQFPALRKKHGYLPVVCNATTQSIWGSWFLKANLFGEICLLFFHCFWTVNH